MGKIVKVSGPLVVATGLEEANMADVVRVGEQRLIGEILTMNSGSASIQVYEETSGLGPGGSYYRFTPFGGAGPRTGGKYLRWNSASVGCYHEKSGWQ